MAEFVLKDMVKKRGMDSQFYIASAATSREEIGNPVHHGTRAKLREVGISCQGKYAVQMTPADYEKYDYILGMEQWNIRNILRIIHADPKGKVKRLLDYSDNPRDIADPWYTGNFEITYSDIVEGCEAFLRYLQEQGRI
jgi:protein-tyrosine phosphatase